MPDLKTDQVITHTLTLTDGELEALRQAARLALHGGNEVLTPQHKSAWEAFQDLGLPAKRGSRTEPHF